MQATFYTRFDGQLKVVTLDDVSEETNKASFSFGRETDEGYEYDTVSYEIIGHTIVCEYASGGRDCDGPIHNYGTMWCHEDDLKGGHQDDENPAIQYPEWQHGDSWIQDDYAQAAGY